MPRKHRLSGASIRSVRSPRRIQGALFSLAVSPREGAAACACVVSKKVAAKAVARNLLKRRTRAILSPLVRALSPGSYIFTAKRAAADASYVDLRKDIELLVQATRGVR